MLVFTFTMFFNGGMITSYILVQKLHLLNTVWSLLLPGAIGVYNLIIAKTFIQNSIPGELLEAARIDGCSDFRILRSIVLPMSKPILATLGLFVSLNYWNDWQNGLYYISNDKMYTIQVLLNRMLLDTLYMQQGLAKNISSSIGASLPTATLKMAIAVLGAIPVLIIFPFISKYLSGGIVVGAVKG